MACTVFPQVLYSSKSFRSSSQLHVYAQEKLFPAPLDRRAANQNFRMRAVEKKDFQKTFLPLRRRVSQIPSISIRVGSKNILIYFLSSRSNS
jgi:hypothetical protein